MGAPSALSAGAHAREEGLEPVFSPEKPVCRDNSSWRIPAEKTLSLGVSNHVSGQARSPN